MSFFKLFSGFASSPISQLFICLAFLVINLHVHAQDTQEHSSSTISKGGDIHIQLPVVPDGSQGFIVTIYRDKENFLKQADEEYYLGIEKLADGKLIIPNILYGQIALSVAADMDGDKKLKTKIFGIPAEPVGFVNNPKPKFGPPSFKECVFTHGKSPLTVSITLQEL